MVSPAQKSHGTMKLREALRGLRHVLRSGGSSFKETLSTDVFPSPAADLAELALRRSRRLAKGIDHFASGAARKVIGAPKQTVPSLRSVASQQDGGLAFSTAFYAGTQAVLKLINAERMFVSELNACKAFRQTGVTGDANAEFAAKLTLMLHDAQVLTGFANGAVRVPQALIEPVALFAVVLWLQSDRSEIEDEDALGAATDLSVAIASDIGMAFLARDQAALAALFSEFSRHV